MDGDVDLEEAHRFKEAGMPCVHSPRIPLGSRRWIPRRKLASNLKFSNFLKLIILAASVSRHNPVTSPPQHLSLLHCSTKQHQQRPQTYVLELTSNFLILCSINPNKPPRAWHVSNTPIRPTIAEPDLCTADET
jgi:hypothetical protein